MMFVRFDEGYPSGSPLKDHDHRLDDLMPSPAPATAVAVIEGIATGAPTHVVDQREAAARVVEMFAEPLQQARIPRIYEKTKIDRRHMAVDPLDPQFDAL